MWWWEQEGLYLEGMHKVAQEVDRTEVHEEETDGTDTATEY